MKYYEFLELIEANITEQDYFLCCVLMDVMKEYPQCSSEHVKKFKKYINRLLSQTKKEIPEDSVHYGFRPSSLFRYLLTRHGENYDRVLSRKHLVQKLISYHKKRGN